MPLASSRELTPGGSAIAAVPAEAASADSRPARVRSLICRSVRRICADMFGSDINAIVLTGSLARGEATVARIADSYSILGDAEFLLVLEKREKLPSSANLDVLRRRIERDLLEHRVTCKVDLSAVHPDYFRRLPPHIFSYELKRCGRVIWGDDEILRTIPEYSTVDLSTEDATRLLANRLVELLECAPEFANEGNSLSPAFHYKLTKLHLDMATSLLVFLRSYAPTYRERQEILLRLASQRAEITSPFEMIAFAADLAVCTTWKLGPHESPEPVPNLPWREIVYSARSLWRWELLLLTGLQQPIADEELFKAWNRMQSWKANLRGWIRVLQSCGWRRSRRHWLRWVKLGRVIGPRFGVYQAAFGLLFSSSSDLCATLNEANSKMDISGLRRLLPIAGLDREGSERSDPLSLAAEIVSNYRDFLVGTRI